jgi:hypothetical protein
VLGEQVDDLVRHVTGQQCGAIERLTAERVDHISPLWVVERGDGDGHLVRLRS